MAYDVPIHPPRQGKRTGGDAHDDEEKEEFELGAQGGGEVERGSKETSTFEVENVDSLGFFNHVHGKLQ